MSTPPPEGQRFHVLEQISCSEAEVVWRARDQVLQREVFLKRLGDEAKETLGWEKDKILREARALARIDHPGILRLYDVLEDKHGPLLLLEPLAGSSLAARLERDGFMSAREVQQLASQICEGLQAVHAAGIVHRGLSAQNILLRPDGSACLTGFSFAKPGDGSLGLSSIDYRGGERKDRALPPHPAPEQVSGQTADARSDIFGLGCVLYEALCGKPAFPGGNTSLPPTDPQKLLSGVPKAFTNAIMSCLSRSPVGRPPTAMALQQALEAGLPEKEAVTAASGQGSRLPLVLASSAIAVLAVCILLWATGVFDSPPPNPEKGPRWVEPPTPYSDEYDTSYALLIGIDYAGSDWTELPNAENDIRALAEQLKKMGEPWKVIPLAGKDASESRIRASLEGLRKKAKKDDRVLVYYAGHGVHSEIFGQEKRAWILPADAQPEKMDPGYSNWIPFDYFIKFLKDVPAKHAMLALDCCYSGLAVVDGPRRNSKLKGRSPELDAKRDISRRAHVVIASGRGYQQVPDGRSGQNSPFTAAFLSFLQSTKYKHITARELYGKLKRACSNQDPHMTYFRDSTHPADDGEFLFITSKK